MPPPHPPVPLVRQKGYHRKEGPLLPLLGENPSRQEPQVIQRVPGHIDKRLPKHRHERRGSIAGPGLYAPKSPHLCVATPSQQAKPGFNKRKSHETSFEPRFRFENPPSTLVRVHFRSKSMCRAPVHQGFCLSQKRKSIATMEEP